MENSRAELRANVKLRTMKSAHTSKLCRSALPEFRWEILQHPPYSPDLAPSDFFLFPKLKEAIKCVQHKSKEAAKCAALQWLGITACRIFQEWPGAMAASYGEVS